VNEGIHGCDAAPLGKTGTFLLSRETRCDQEGVTFISIAEVEILCELKRPEVRGVTLHFYEVVHWVRTWVLGIHWNQKLHINLSKTLDVLSLVAPTQCG
jgi:hypothetical protein